MYRRISERAVRRATPAVGALVVFGMLAMTARATRGAGPDDTPPPLPLRQEIRSGGVVEESHVYHRQQPARLAGGARSGEPAGGWCGYGFPVSTFRWGWFGGAHYYPTVFWHKGYYGDCCRYSYRRGY